MHQLVDMLEAFGIHRDSTHTRKNRRSLHKATRREVAKNTTYSVVGKVMSAPKLSRGCLHRISCLSVQFLCAGVSAQVLNLQVQGCSLGEGRVPIGCLGKKNGLSRSLSRQKCFLPEESSSSPVPASNASLLEGFMGALGKNVIHSQDVLRQLTCSRRRDKTRSPYFWGIWGFPAMSRPSPPSEKYQNKQTNKQTNKQANRQSNTHRLPIVLSMSFP